MIRLLLLLVLAASSAAAGSASADKTLLPAYLLQVPATVRTVLIAETETATLHRYEFDSNGLQSSSQVYMSIGQNGPGKQRSGDRRTPLGIYFANDVLDTSRLHEKYGPIAFPLDYPNAWDDRNERTGDGIWIHGVVAGGGQRPARDTDGCIALPNAELLELQEFLQLLHTPVIITRNLQMVESATLAATRERLNAALQTWVDSYLAGDWHRYLGLYASQFEYRGLDRDEWSSYRVRSGNTRRLRDFAIDDVTLLNDPEDETLFLSRFRQTIVDDAGRIVTIKRLYWRLHEDGQLRIVAEDNG